VSVSNVSSVFGGLERAEYDRLTRELTGYCYRMLGSPFDAEDAVQDTMMRGFREIDRFEGRSSVRTWLYRIATNVCLDMLRSRGRRCVPMDLQSPSPGDGSEFKPAVDRDHWVLPVPDAWIDPAERAVARESVRLAFVAALQRLTPRQRAVLILRDVLQFSAAETAEFLGSTLASANSALQRARDAVQIDDDAASQFGPAAPEALLDEYVAAFEAYDMSRLTALLRSDVVQSMPPYGMWLLGPAEIARWMLGTGAACRGSRLLRTAANGYPAFAQYRSDGHGGHAPFSVHVIHSDGELVSAMHIFVLPELFPVFGFPPAL
jgi:RNA polymerase sigma-70 factor, ECF subfamily